VTRVVVDAERFMGRLTGSWAALGRARFHLGCGIWETGRWPVHGPTTIPRRSPWARPVASAALARRRARTTASAPTP